MGDDSPFLPVPQGGLQLLGWLQAVGLLSPAETPASPDLFLIKFKISLNGRTWGE